MKINIIVLLLLISTRIFAFQYDESPWSNKNAEGKLSSYPKFIYNIMQSYGGWKPRNVVSNECSEALRNTYSLKKENLWKLEQFSNLAEKCEFQKPLNIFEKQMSRLFVHFDLESSHFKKVDFTIRNGLVVRGLLGLHKEKRPLVILRMGIHGNRDEVLAERFIVRALFEDLNMHVLVLESSTSHGYIVQNERVGFGALEEGLQTYYILNLIRENQKSERELNWASKIDSLHLFGVSMAGAGVFYADLLDQTSLIEGHVKPMLKSVQLFCPLINFEENFVVRSKPTLANAFIDMWNRRRLIGLKEKNPDLYDITDFMTLFDFKVRFSKNVINWFNLQEQPILNEIDFKKQFSDLQFVDDVSLHLQHKANFLDKLKFWSHYRSKQNLFTIYSTPNDPLVDNEVNIDKILKHTQPGDFSNVQVLPLKGVHCAFASEYEWPFIVEIIKQGLQ